MPTVYCVSNRVQIFWCTFVTVVTYIGAEVALLEKLSVSSQWKWPFWESGSPEVYSLQLLSCLMHILYSLNSHYSSLSFVAEGSVHTRQPARRSLLVLGDEPKCRRRAYSRPEKRKPTVTFNHCMCPSLRLIFKYPIVFVSYKVLQSTSGEGWAL